ncbi:MAG: hypothetical protein QM698_07465 [Micropepsaceae bacterium]
MNDDAKLKDILSGWRRGEIAYDEIPARLGREITALEISQKMDAFGLRSRTPPVFTPLPQDHPLVVNARRLREGED